MQINETNHQVITKAFNKVTASKQIHEAVLYVENTKGDFSKAVSYHGRDIDSAILLASITKLFTTTCILILYEQGKLLLSDKIVDYLDKDMLKGLHTFKGKEYTGDLTISDLLFQTSGLPDAFEDGKNASRKMMDMISQKDDDLPFAQTLHETATMSAKFAPRSGRAYYANINFDLLGVIIESILHKDLREIFQDLICSPLGLKKTYLASEKDDVPCTFYKMKKLKRPKLIASSKASGGCVSTSREVMVFMKAFWQGMLFNKVVFKELAIYKKVQPNKGPIRYGGGYMQIPLGGITNLFMGKGELLGHCGSTGSFAFYDPEKDIYMVGDLAQLAKPAMPIRLVMKLAMQIK